MLAQPIALRFESRQTACHLVRIEDFVGVRELDRVVLTSKGYEDFISLGAPFAGGRTCWLDRRHVVGLFGLYQERSGRRSRIRRDSSRIGGSHGYVVGFTEDSTGVSVDATPGDSVPVDSVDPNVSAAQNETIDKLVLLVDGGLNAWQTNVSVLPIAFTINGEFYRQSAYALEVDAFGSDSPLSDEQKKNRANFSRLVSFLKDPVEGYGAANLGAATAYVPTTYSLWGARYGIPQSGLPVGKGSADGSRSGAELGPVRSERVPVSDSPAPKLVKVPWPHASISLESTGEQPTCLPVVEADSAAVAATFASVPAPVNPSATTTAFEQPDGVLAELVLIPVFPGMTTCSPDGDPYRIFGDPQ